MAMNYQLQEALARTRSEEARREQHTQQIVQRNEELSRQLEELNYRLRTAAAQGHTAPNAQTLTPGGATPQPSLMSESPMNALGSQRYEKPRLPDVEVFEQGTHEQYAQWKLRVRAKLFADQLAYPTEEL